MKHFNKGRLLVSLVSVSVVISSLPPDCPTVASPLAARPRGRSPGRIGEVRLGWPSRPGPSRGGTPLAPSVGTAAPAARHCLACGARPDPGRAHLAPESSAPAQPYTGQVAPTRVIPRALALLLALVAAGCGGSSSPSTEPASEAETSPAGQTGGPAPDGSIQALLEEDPAEDSALIFGTSDYAVGQNRLSFLLVDSAGALVEAESARVRVATGGLAAVPDGETTAKLIPVGVPPEAGDFDAPTVYVANLDLADPGEYTILVEPEGADIQGFGQIQVAAESPSRRWARTPSPRTTRPSRTGSRRTSRPRRRPTSSSCSTRSSTRSRTARRSSSRSRRRSSARAGSAAPSSTSSTASSEASREPTSASSTSRSSRTTIRQRATTSGWRSGSSPTEPWTFVVDATASRPARFEGLVSVHELEAAVATRCRQS